MTRSMPIGITAPARGRGIKDVGGPSWVTRGSGNRWKVRGGRWRRGRGRYEQGNWDPSNDFGVPTGVHSCSGIEIVCALREVSHDLGGGEVQRLHTVTLMKDHPGTAIPAGMLNGYLTAHESMEKSGGWS